MCISDLSMLGFSLNSSEWSKGLDFRKNHWNSMLGELAIELFLSDSDMSLSILWNEKLFLKNN